MKVQVWVYISTAWSLFTGADHYRDYDFSTDEPFEVFAKRLAREGFEAEDSGHRLWIMPGSIIYCKVVD